MRKTNRAEFLDNPDKDERKKLIEAALKELDSNALSQGEIPRDIASIKGRYYLSISTIMWSAIIGTVLLTLSSVYFSFLPRPISYISTQDGKLYEIKPVRVER